ncbi:MULTISPECIES: PBP1A family penicillin-binding protein [unclassified Devosia]|uniref:transglycosylase domain-containing protein n=1 Tax=unclassified Devosia TaxID=196773 RepID=UPI0015524F73|nr:MULTISPECIES: PBP1A family penicillin-binding protein [unclassified Devosia]
MGRSVGVFVDDERTGGASPGPKGAKRPAQKRGKATPPRRPGKPKRRRSGAGGFLIGVLHWGFVLCLWVGIAIAGVVVYYGAQLPSSDTWAVPDRPPNIRILAADGQLISNRGQTGGEATVLRELPQYVPAALLAIEDRRFYDHFGVDIVGLAAVAVESLQAGRVTRGASTITQQLAKNLFLTPDQTIGRKVQEALLAVWLEQNYSKDEILELYLNRVFFGHNSYGIEAAAQTYFGKSARNLSLGEAAMLAGSLQAPSRLNPKSDPAATSARQKLVLSAMAEEGYITREEAQAAQIDPDQTIRTKVAGSESYVADWVESLMTAYIGEIEGDVVVSTTVDWDLQKQAEFIVREAVANEGPKRGFTQGALVAMDVDGTVRAMVGGVDYQASQYNRAVTAKRQPGSTFKPFVYLAAMEKGYTPDTLAEDAQFEYQGWSPRNASGKYAGTVTLRQGLAYSLNTIAARLAIDVTPQAVIDTAMRMGISSPLTAVPSIALGTQEVNLLELTSAYAPFANGGMGVIPNVITRIESKDGEVLYEASTAGPGRVIAPNILAEMNDMLKTAVEVGTGKGANLNGWPFGGKTGTSQESKDALFVGYTARMVTGVWLGNDDNTKTTLSGGNVPAAIWSQFMTKAHEGLEVAQIPAGSGEASGAGGAVSSQPVAQPVYDPQTGQQAVDPTTGQPMVQYVDPATGEPVDGFAEAASAPAAQIDPTTGLPVDAGQSAPAIDQATGYPAGTIVDASGQQIDPATGYPVGEAAPGFDNTPIDPDTGMPMQLVVDPATGQEVWVPSQPAQQAQPQWQQQQPQGIQPPGDFVAPQPVESFAPPQPVQTQPAPSGERKPRTLMDMIFGG